MYPIYSIAKGVVRNNLFFLHYWKGGLYFFFSLPIKSCFKNMLDLKLLRKAGPSGAAPFFIGRRVNQMRFVYIYY